MPMRLKVTVQISSHSETLLVPVAEEATVSQLCTDIERRVAKIPGSNDFKVSCLRLGMADGARLDAEDPVQLVLTESDVVFAERAPTITETYVESPDRTDPREEAQAKFTQPPTETYVESPDRTDPREEAQAATPGTPGADSKLLAELKEIEFKTLKLTAIKIGFDENAVGNVDEADDPKQPIIDMILSKKKEMKAMEFVASLQVNDEVEVYCRSRKQWLTSVIVEILPRGSVHVDCKHFRKILPCSQCTSDTIRKKEEHSLRRVNTFSERQSFLEMEMALLANEELSPMSDTEHTIQQANACSERQCSLEVNMASLANQEQTRVSPRVSLPDLAPMSPREHTIQQAATEDQPSVGGEYEALLEVGLQRVLIIGSTGDGKSTLVNHLILDTEGRAEASQTVTGTTKSVRPYRGKKGRLILDTPGVGDCTIPPLKLMAMLEEVLSPHGLGVDYVVITTSLLTTRFELGIQIVQTLVEKGFLQEGGGREWDHIIFCGTKKDKADKGDFQCFQDKAELFYKDAPNQTGLSAVVGFENDKQERYDITRLEEAMKVHQKIKFQKVNVGELALKFAEKLGFKDREVFAKELSSHRDKMENDSGKLEKALIAFSERQKEIDESLQKWLKELRRGNLNEKQVSALQSFFKFEISRAWQKEAHSVESCEFFDLARKEADYQVVAQSNMFCLQMRAALEGSHRTRLRGKTLESLTKIAKEEGIGTEVLDKCGQDTGAVLQIIVTKRAKQDMAAIEAMARTPISGDDPMTLASLKGMTMAELKKIAKAMAIDHQLADESKDAVIQKILAKKLLLTMMVEAPPRQADSSGCPREYSPSPMQPAPESWDIFCCHTKSSLRWSCNDFVQIHLWDFLEKNGIPAFYDAVSLPGRKIDECLKAAGRVKVMVVVLDDQAPSDWMLAEIRVALQSKIPVQTVYRKDMFSWAEVGKPSWKMKNVPENVVQGVFERPSLDFDCTARYIYAARNNLLHIILGLVSNASA